MFTSLLGEMHSVTSLMYVTCIITYYYNMQHTSVVVTDIYKMEERKGKELIVVMICGRVENGKLKAKS